MGRKRNPIIEAISDPTKSFMIFLVAGILINLLASGLSELFWKDFLGYVQKTWRLKNPIELRFWVVLVLFGLLIALIYAINIPQLSRSLWGKLRWVDIPFEAKVQPDPSPCLGLVVIMSLKSDSPAERAIRYHWNQGQEPHLLHCWIICTETSLPHAHTLHQQLIKEGTHEYLHLHYDRYPLPNPENIDAPLSLTVSDADANDPDSILKLVDGIYADAQRYGLEESDLIVDFTGGTKPLGVGVFLACTHPNRRLEYITQEPEPRVVEIKAG